MYILYYRNYEIFAFSKHKFHISGYKNLLLQKHQKIKCHLRKCAQAKHNNETSYWGIIEVF